MNTTENNKLIAEFMGLVANPIYYIPDHEELQRIPYSYECEDVCHFKASELKYHKSWDWLIPVVEKIESLPSINQAGICLIIEHSYCRIYLDDWGKYTDVAQCITKKDKLGAVYQAVVKFIKWYNKNK